MSWHDFAAIGDGAQAAMSDLQHHKRLRPKHQEACSLLPQVTLVAAATWSLLLLCFYVVAAISGSDSNVMRLRYLSACPFVAPEEGHSPSAVRAGRCSPLLQCVVTAVSLHLRSKHLYRDHRLHDDLHCSPWEPETLMTLPSSRFEARHAPADRRFHLQD